MTEEEFKQRVFSLRARHRAQLAERRAPAPALNDAPSAAGEVYFNRLRAAVPQIVGEEHRDKPPHE